MIVTAGFVLSTFTVYEAVPVLPALSLHVAVRVSAPSPLDVVVAVQWAVSIAEPGLDQCQVTTTSVLFQPLPFAAGSCVGAAVRSGDGDAPGEARLAAVAGLVGRADLERVRARGEARVAHRARARRGGAGVELAGDGVDAAAGVRGGEGERGRARGGRAGRVAGDRDRGLRLVDLDGVGSGRRTTRRSRSPCS